MQNSIFTQIINGQIPCHRIYEDDKVLAFLDIHPKIDGHTLVIPKKQVEFVWDLPDEDYTALMAAVKKIALRIRDTFGKPYVGEAVEGLDVPHAHIHLYPFSVKEEARFIPDPNGEPDHARLAAIAKKLAF